MITQLKAERGSASLHLELALKYAQSGLAVLPARISFNATEAKWDRFLASRTGKTMHRPTRTRSANGGRPSPVRR